jgi:hypothetical protein
LLKFFDFRPIDKLAMLNNGIDAGINGWFDAVDLTF